MALSPCCPAGCSTHTFVKDDQRTKGVYSWEERILVVDDLAQGTAALVAREQCPHCADWLDTGPTMWMGQTQVHVACKDTALAAERTRLLDTGLTDALPSAIPAWVAHIPETTLRALVYATMGEDEDAPLTAVQDLFMQLITDSLEAYRNAE